MWKACSLAIALALAGAFLVATTQGSVPQRPPRHPYYPFTVEVEIWDTGANPWDNGEQLLR